MDKSTAEAFAVIGVGLILFCTLLIVTILFGVAGFVVWLATLGVCLLTPIVFGLYK